MLLLPVFSLLLNGIGGQCTGAKCDSDTAELLQLQKRKKVALALSGGGFKAQATFAGFIPALLNAKDSTTKDLLSEVDAITCASSGCWYTSQLIYSQLFLNMTETMAQSPNAAGDVFAKRWIRPFLAAFEAGWSVPILQSSDEHRRRPTWTSGEEKVTGAGEDLLEILLETYWLTSGKMSKTWTEFVNIVLAGSMPDMNRTMKLNSPVNDWAKGKLWAVGTSVSMPGGSGPGTCHATDFDKSGLFCAVSPDKARSTVYDNGTDATLAYFSRESSGQSLASWMPACFSVQLGVSAAKSALPFCPSCLGATQHYENNGGEMEEVLKSLDFDANTPVLPVVTAASAFLGELMVLPIYDAKTLKWLTDLVGAAIGFLPFVHQDFVKWIEDDLFKALLTQWAVWSFTADTRNSFAEGTMARQEAIASNAQPPRNSFETLASKRMMGMVDAGLSDNTAIGHALSAGKKEIIYVSCAGVNDLWRLFQGMKKDGQFFKIPGFNFCPFCYANVPAFQEQMKHSKRVLEEELRAFTLDHPEMLTELKVGTMKLTTVKSEFWGIEADREVTLRLIIFDSSAQLGGFAYQDYPKLVQDIMDTFRSPANSELANLVLSWFEAP